MTFDFIIKKAQVVDGTGAQSTVEDIGIKGDAIAAVGDLSAAEAARVIDAENQVATPGFIDMHNHFDQTVLLYPAAQSAVAQGITTAVTGQCGFSPAPLNKHYLACFWEWDWWDRVRSRKYYQEVVGDLDKVRAAAKEVQNLDIDWSTFDQWLRRVEQSRPGVNLVPLVGHGTVRAAVMGLDYRRIATQDEVGAMRRYVEQAMDEGAWGISNGMDYAPNAFCSKEESYEVIGAAVKKGGFFSSHWRRTGLREGFGNPGLIEGLKEAIDIARKTGARLEIAHLSPGWLMAPSPTPRLSRAAAEETLAVLDEALKSGVDLSFDVIPNHLTGGVIHAKYVAAALTPWLKEAGSMEQLAKNLAAPDLRDEIRQYIGSGKWYSLNPILQPGWASTIVVGNTSVDEFRGKSIMEIARSTGRHPLDTLMDVIQRDPHATRAEPKERPDEIKRIFYKHPRAMVGIDTFLVDETAGSRIPPYYLPNPNTYGGMARFIKQYVLGLLGLEEGIRRLTGLPAERLGLRDRGVIAEGKKADLVIFQPEAVVDKTTSEEPRQYPEGFTWVFVNGKPAVEDGRLTLSRVGSVLGKGH
jgi:N-acyl-D-amino-acid deacylase